jgi:hypothetical protein
MADAKKVFLSYSSADIFWKKNFTDEDVFGLGGDVTLIDYKDTSNFGPIKEWLTEQISNAAAVILFLSEHYVSQEYPIFEFWKSLEERTRRQIIFVPIMMDAQAIAWWREQKEIGRLNVLMSGDDGEFAYSNFTDGGKPEILCDNGRYNDQPARRIGELARLIKQRLGEVVNGDSIVDAPVRPQSQNGGPPNPILLLGHPTADMPPDVKQPRDELRAELTKAGLPLEPWQDGWCAKAGAYSEEAPQLLGRDPIFVQPLAPGDYIADHPQTHRDRLKKAVGKESPLAVQIDQRRLYLWLPKGLKDEDFESATPTAPTIHSQLSGSELAEQFCNELSRDRPLVPVIMLEEMLQNAGLRARLSSEFRKVVEQEVSPPPREFRFMVDEDASDMLEDQLAQVVGDKVILAIHDLNIQPSRNSEDALKSLDTKLASYMESVEKAQKKVRRKKLKIFWSTLVVRNVKFFPFVKHPSPQFENWHLLPFNTEGSATPKRGYSKIFLSYLHEWAHPGCQ